MDTGGKLYCVQTKTRERWRVDDSGKREGQKRRERREKREEVVGSLSAQTLTHISLTEQASVPPQGVCHLGKSDLVKPLFLFTTDSLFALMRTIFLI